MKVLGLDVGEKRIGVAKADSDTRIAVPVGFVEVDGTEWQEISKIARLNNTNFFVLGMPRSNEGNETAQSLYVRQFAKTLVEKIPEAKIRFQDESLTSVLAEERLKSRKKSYKKGEIDAEAASIILQDFIENFRSGSIPKEEKIADDPPNGIVANVKNAASNVRETATNITKKETDKMKLNTKKAKHKIKKMTKFVVFPIISVALLAIAGVSIWWSLMLKPVDSNCSQSVCEEIKFVVTEGETKSEIADNLEKAGLIKSSFVFKIYQQFFKSDVDFKSGAYFLNKGLTIDEIIEMLVKGVSDSDVFSFTILPGETIFDIKDKFLKLGYSENEIESGLNADYDFDFLKDRPDGASLEGYLFGETHEFFKDATVKEILEKFLSGMGEVITENNLEARYADHGLSLYEGITLASVVQKESSAPDMPTVAQVFLTRLENGIVMGSDVTVSYAIDQIDPDREIYTDNQSALSIDSCYNTRMYVGLPCGPISNPGISALLAVADPSDTSYLYFLTGDDGVMYYSYTESEHIQNTYSHCQNLCNISL